jgi:hypothetical protein
MGTPEIPIILLTTKIKIKIDTRFKKNAMGIEESIGIN